MTTDELKGQIKAYKEELKHYKTYANVLKRIFEREYPLAVVQAREKSVSSFAEKAVRKRDRYPDAVRMLTDLCGARIVVQTLEQISAVRSFIEAHFQVLEYDDKSKSLHEDEFGYCDVHYIVQLRADRDLGVSPGEWDAIGERKAEIQVRTVLQHGWADILHDRIYKTAISVPPEWRREANRLAALLEKADDAFSKLAASLDSQTSVYEVCLPKSKLAAEIATLHTFLALEEDEQRKYDVILKLAKLLMTAGQWPEAVKLLESHPQPPPEFALELGYARCCACGDAPNSKRFKAGLRLLESVALPAEPVEAPDSYAPAANPLRIRPNLRANALYRLGRAHALCCGNLDAAVDCFRKAHALRADNPYYHVAYVLAQLCIASNGPLLPLVAGSLGNDLQRCRHHVTLGIELPNALFTMARCRLLLGENSACLCAYAKAIEVVLRRDTCVPQRMLSEEIQIVECLSRIKPSISGQVLVLLHLARWQAGFSGSEDSHAWLLKKRLRRKPFKAPVLLVVGGAEFMPRHKVPSYYSYLFESLEHFEGTVVSGGTTSGIPGVVGNVTKTLKDQGSQCYELLTYLPKELPPKTGVHPSYTVAGRTPENDFSERELIACWCDLLLSGIEPQKIVVLGINGGHIADFEYRLALAFGAKVGVMRDSGRAAAALLADPDWQGSRNLCELPEDPLVVWAFANQYNNPTLPPAIIAAAAPRAHEFYRQHRWRKGETSDESLKPWADLGEDLKASNRGQISFITNLLRKCNFTIGKRPAPQAILFSTAEILELAKREHARFVMERLSQGWVYGEPKDVAGKISPYLVPWEQVPSSVQDYDREAVSLFPKLLAELGYEIHRPGP
jgi:ppGpp synthetase/RelA/SpoT-type nucleotidyltranferase